MKLLLSSRVEDIDLLKGMLAQEGIESDVTNYTAPIGGAEFYPKLWVEDADFPKASAVLSAFRSAAPQRAECWTCPFCGETLEEQFTSCWKCGAVRGETV
jgi:hypothetical protein